MPSRVTIRKGEKFDALILKSFQPNVDSIISFDYGGYKFNKPYGGSDLYANLNARDIVRFLPQGALIGTPPPNTNGNAVQDGSGLPNGGMPQNNPIYSEGKPIDSPNSVAIGEPNPNAPTNKSTSGTSIFQFKDKLHAGVTLVGVALGVYYGYKTKASIGKYIGYALGAGAIGFILGSVASSYAMQTSIKQLKEEGSVPEGAKPAFTGAISPNLEKKGRKLDTSIEGGTMNSQMNAIL
jgi:hypothetical protein